MLLMKVKKSQQMVTVFKHQSYLLHLSYCIIHVVFTICLVNFGWHRMHVDAYIDRPNNLTNHFQQYRPYRNVHAMNASHPNEWSFRTRDGRFLFDAFFGIDTPPIGADEFEDDDDEEEAPKPCRCGKFIQQMFDHSYSRRH